MTDMLDKKRGKFCKTEEDLTYNVAFGSAVQGCNVVNVAPDVPAAFDPTDTAKTPRKAMIVLEADATCTSDDIVARFSICGDPPTNVYGLPLAHLGSVCIGHPDNISNFKIISVKPAVNHTLRVVFYE